MTDDTRPAIPMSLAHRPVMGGLSVPWVNLTLADGGVDFRAPHHAKAARCWTEGLCQTCGNPTGHPAVLFGGPNQLAAGQFDEPPLCVPCAMYASRACPMVAGRQSHYADRARISEGKRGHVCPDEHCDCGGWVPTDPNVAHPWFAVYIKPMGYAVTVYDTVVRCSDRGCEHPRRIVNGGRLLAPPLRVVLVSSPGEGRVWRRLAVGEWPSIQVHATT